MQAEQRIIYATSCTAPPAALIFFSAYLETNLALTKTGCSGKLPAPRTLKYPCFVTSMTAAPELDAASFRPCKHSKATLVTCLRNPLEQAVGPFHHKPC